MADQGYNLKYTGKEIDDLLDKADTMNSSAQVPIGGTSGQVLAKKSATDYDLKWVDQSTGGDTHGIPAGGISGQVLTKKSSANFDAEWKTPVSAGVQSVNGESGAVVLTADDVDALAKSTYDPQGRQTDIFKAIDKVSNIYYARLTLNGWTPTRRPFWSWPRCWLEVNDMVQFYVCCIKRGLITLDKVPEKWRDAVKVRL